MDAAQGLALDMIVTRIAAGVYRVDIEGRAETVYVAGPPEQAWAFWNGRVFAAASEAPATAHRVDTPQRNRQLALSAPMPAKVIKVLVQPGAAVVNGQVVVLLEAMKMELPVRSTANAVVRAVHCREGDLVQPETVLVQLDADA